VKENVMMFDLKRLTGRFRPSRLLSLSIAVALLATLGVVGLASAKPLFAYDTALWRVSDRIGIRTDTPDANTVLDATRSGADTYIKSRNSSLGAYFQTQSGALWAGYNMLNQAGTTSTYFGYRGSTQFRVYDAIAGQDRILMDAAGTSNGKIYLNPSNTGSVGIGTTSPYSNTLRVVSTSSGWDAITADMNTTAGGSYAVDGTTLSTAGIGVQGGADSTTGTSYGVYGYSYSPDGYGVAGFGGYAYAGDISGWIESGGIFGSDVGNGLIGFTTDTGTVGVIGINDIGTGGSAVLGSNGTTVGYAGYFEGGNTALYAFGGSAYAAYFSGNVHVNGTLTKSAGGFQIDHPLDPSKVLNHSFVESPDMKNIYDGVVTLDENGEAWVELPDWFEALNQDFRYQLTPIGASMPDLYIAQGVEDNAFKIAGGVAGLEVSWQVTGIRHDAYAEAHRIPVEQDKPAEPTSLGQLPGIDANPTAHEAPRQADE
jgi:hypothetical protein